jgi:hypothetical protein
MIGTGRPDVGSAAIQLMYRVETGRRTLIEIDDVLTAALRMPVMTRPVPVLIVGTTPLIENRVVMAASGSDDRGSGGDGGVDSVRAKYRLQRRKRGVTDTTFPIAVALTTEQFS